MIDLVSDHLEKNGELLSQEDVLKVVRPICENLKVRTDLKMEILKHLERSFELCGDDMFLLVFYQTDAIITATWGRKVRNFQCSFVRILFCCNTCNCFHLEAKGIFLKAGFRFNSELSALRSLPLRVFMSSFFQFRSFYRCFLFVLITDVASISRA